VGEYQIDATLTNNLGKKTVKTAAAKIVTEEAPKPLFVNVKTVTSPKKVTFTFQVENDSPANRAKNRRTRIIIMPKIDQFYDMLEKEMKNLEGK
jgi:hypothetical protein